ncbi:MAG: hypothetical protein AVDCRST_MAG95-1287 [uncultured Adhaeribacter sp.]|uniref:Uncharacterized protein n=1 Tax=uncultured Adhaeribacter sp. TaxID=448109 RepID=A0A6J4HZL1_9BACT|nr:MAG: hypothetical protein AVDCRST_MAG95-1287 [uncultured Adhaeribacter sp.]
MKTTNYYNTFIQVAADCPAELAEIPPRKNADKTTATIQFELIYDNPYQYTSDDVLFEAYAIKQNINSAAYKPAREAFFSKGQPCFRASPLTKRYGWGVHCNAEGKIALYAVESDEYRHLTQNNQISHVKAMRLKREK